MAFFDPQKRDSVDAKLKEVRQKALAAGYSPEEITFMEEKMRAKTDILNKITYVAAKAAPGAFGIVGGLTGATLGSFAAPVVGTVSGGTLGSTAGVGGGLALEDMLMKASGMRQDTSSQQAADQLKKMAIGTGTTFASGLAIDKLAILAKALIKPKVATANYANKQMTGKSLDTARINEALVNAPNEAKTPAMQEAIRKRAGQISPELLQYQTTPSGNVLVPEQIPLTDYYSRIREIPIPKNTYGQPAAYTDYQVRAAQTVDRILRDLPYELPGTTKLQAANKLYSLLMQTGKYAPSFWKGAAGTAGAGLAGYGLYKAAISGNK